MSRAGAPQGRIDESTGDHKQRSNGVRVTIVAASWHEQVMSGLIAGAERTLIEAGAQWRTVRVPGSFELPLAAQAAFDGGADAVVALGVVIRGGTPHFDFVCEAATSGLTSVALDKGRPVGFGLLTCDDEQQAIDRAGGPDASEDKGAEAAAAALDLQRQLGILRHG
ncbi:6,7-dimethyl-8-ribityllumazine synthase [Pseudoclavibacter sp. 13-3]|uniref:6,7-dimethyl-8-ribityllumazine synthase n=1 Tax=Pseudoclavibacter sp. 13-3 TaxID=2901228 RepID=UPI001E33361C|nr:6,7-dimethyl-8-ribityllumazine synthase [Pseudoclavibacter sp. 13-3]MCD7102186.1 6,7-dimethyl-8-ribityllumazine synthase [Pseudoclavibacter sp. 13-3]